MMTTISVMDREWSGKAQAFLGTVIEHLGHRDYRRAAEMLIESKVIFGQTDDPVAAHVLNAAHRICLACRQTQEEAEWHGRAYAEVLEREQVLRRELQTILDLISKPDRLALPRIEEISSYRQVVDTGKRNRSASNPAEFHRLWHRIHDLVQAMIQPRRQTPTERPAEATMANAIELSSEDFHTPLSEPGAAANREPASTPFEAPPSLAVCCLGPFQVYLNDQLVEDWRNGKAKSVFKYLIAHHDRPVPKEILMDVFWPDANPDHARNSLNVTIYHIRQTLSVPPSFSHVLFQNNCYLLNPELEIWIDSDAFSEHVALAGAMDRNGNQESAIHEYCAADALYGGGFLEEDRYEEWIVPMRQTLEDDYLKLLDRLSHYYFERQDYDKCMTVCNESLAVDACQEEAHRQMMRCYSRQKQPNLAMRQYQNCVKALEHDLEVEPSPSTVELVQQIRNRGCV